ncbi:sugar transferase [Flavobacterium sp.]|jgi:lipopolysaccharide/colanic/teichoic acid biosynthesis glycosyltransferase|uniref:sugar transferase n=1 Tax=Flavobacterium sp. TaxID=239 RepID=UPI0037C1015A
MIKTLFDTLFSILLLLTLGILIIIILLLASIDTGSFGFFFQDRVGQYGKIFKIIKIKTLHLKTGEISTFGKFLRKSKFDELPQLINILFGQMSFVGPRPDIKGYYDKLEGDEQKILLLKPGLTSLASIKYSNEDEILKKQFNPLKYNDEVIFPDKVKMNLDYYYNHSFFIDLKIILKTIFR